MQIYLFNFSGPINCYCSSNVVYERLVKFDNSIDFTDCIKLSDSGGMYIEATTFHGNFCKKFIGICFWRHDFEIIVWNICPRPVVWLGSFLPRPQLWPEQQ